MKVHAIIHFIVHEEYESPGAIETWAKKNQYQFNFSKVYKGDPLPDVNDFDLLVIMGGPQSPSTTLEECPYFDAKAEIDLIKRAIAANKLVLGVCLGAQLIGEACGAQFAHSPQKEIGVFEMSLTAAGREDPLLAHFPESFSSGHWHNDMPGLSTNAVILAQSQGCPRQIVRYTPRVYGFQCHMEFNEKVVEKLIKHCPQDLEAQSPYVQTPQQILNENYQSMNQLLFGFLDRFVAAR